MKISRMTKIAGASLIGFCAVSIGADKVNLNPMTSQIAGFVGAFLGSLVAQRRRSGNSSASPRSSSEPNAAAPPEVSPREK